MRGGPFIRSWRSAFPGHIYTGEDCAEPAGAEGAMNALGEVTGRTLRADLTARIFERLCVGR